MTPKSSFRPVVLVVLDGWGIGPPGEQNPLTVARTPFFDSLQVAYPHTRLEASGEAVGLPSGTAGNSEVGHINIGAGFVVHQDLQRINRSIADGSFFKNPALLKACLHVLKNKSRLHLMGLISPAVVHSSLEHLYALLRLSKEQGVRSVFVHAFTDGRDSPPTSAQVYLSELLQKMDELGIGRVASVVGRYYAMDRDERWARTRLAYELLVKGRGRSALSPLQAISMAYKNRETDEFIKPTAITRNSRPIGLVQNGDAVVFFNFRTDRPRQLTKAFVLPEFAYFDRGRKLRDLFFVSLTLYEKGLPVSAVAYQPQDVELPLAKVLSIKGFRQLHLAESEKFPHVTYFFNGGHEDSFVGEDRIEIPSPKVPTYDLKPEMAARPVTEVLLERIQEELYDFIIVNYANPDMVAHTGVFDACIKAAEVVDECLRRVITEVKSCGGAVFITADHGNIEILRNSVTGSTDTEHNISPVPFVSVFGEPQRVTLQRGILADVAPTILALMGVAKPSTMTGRNLLAELKP